MVVMAAAATGEAAGRAGPGACAAACGAAVCGAGACACVYVCAGAVGTGAGRRCSRVRAGACVWGWRTSDKLGGDSDVAGVALLGGYLVKHRSNTGQALVKMERCTPPWG